MNNIMATSFLSFSFSELVLHIFTQLSNKICHLTQKSNFLSFCVLQMWASFTAIVPSPCPSLSGLCAAGEDCQVYPTSLPFTGTKPDPGWCVRQWQKVVPSNYNAAITLGYEAHKRLFSY